METKNTKAANIGKEDAKSYMEISKTLKEAMPQGTNLLTALRVSQLLLADVIAQMQDVDDAIWYAIFDDTRNFARSFKESYDEDDEEVSK